MAKKIKPKKSKSLVEQLSDLRAEAASSGMLGTKAQVSERARRKRRGMK